MQETQVQSLGQEDPLEEAWQPTPVFFPGESHGQRSLAGYSPRGHKESDRLKQLSTPVSYSGSVRLKWSQNLDGLHVLPGNSSGPS